MTVKQRNPGQWRADVLAALRATSSWLGASDLTWQLTASPRRRGAGRVTQNIRRICEQLVTDGLAERREVRHEGAPYGQPMIEYRGRRCPGCGTFGCLDDRALDF